MSGKYAGDSLCAIQNEWSANDLLDAHEFLDLFERSERRQHDKMVEQRESAAHGNRG